MQKAATTGNKVVMPKQAVRALIPSTIGITKATGSAYIIGTMPVSLSSNLVCSVKKKPLVVSAAAHISTKEVTQRWK